MVISSLVVETFPGRTDAVAESLSEKSHVEVHGIQNHQVIVTIEADTVGQSHDIASDLINLDGVGNVNLIYANFEDDPYIKEMAKR